MSILIKGMEMPSCCAACKVLCDAKSETGFIRPFGERLPNCPLIKLPPHGDLIDRDALVRDNGIKEIPEYYEVVRDAPTIIPAEPCNDLAKPNNTIFAVQNADEDEWLFAAKPIDYMHTPSVEEIIEADGLDSFIKHFED